MYLKKKQKQELIHYNFIIQLFLSYFIQKWYTMYDNIS